MREKQQSHHQKLWRCEQTLDRETMKTVYCWHVNYIPNKIINFNV